MNEDLAPKVKLDRLKVRVDAFTALEPLNELKDRLLPKLQKFSDAFDRYEEDNRGMKECIREFDKTLSIKANKASIHELKQEIGEEYILASTWDKI